MPKATDTAPAAPTDTAPVEPAATSEVSSAPTPPPAPAPAPPPTPAKPLGKPSPAPQGIPPHVLAAMGGVPFAPPPAAAQTAPRAARASRQDTGGLLAGPSPASRQVRKQIDQIRTQLGQLVKTCDTAMHTLLPVIGQVSLAPEVCAQEGFDSGAALKFVEDLRVTLEAHFPHSPPRA